MPWLFLRKKCRRITLIKSVSQPRCLATGILTLLFRANDGVLVPFLYQPLRSRTRRVSYLKVPIKDLKDGADFTSTQLDKQTRELTNAKAEIAKLTKTVNENEEGRKEMETKFLYLEAYYRRENVNFMNIAVDSTEEREDVEETLRSFLGRDLGLLDARTVEIQRVHRSGKGKDGGPRPILARFLRYKDVQKIFSLGHRLKDTDYQMFRDYPAEIVKRRKEQMKTFKEARKKWNSGSFQSISTR